MSIILLAAGAGGGGGMGNAAILRLARLLRLSRMARMARLFRAMPELLILIKGMVAAMRSVFFTLLLLAIVVYVFGIMFCQLLVDAQLDEGIHFETVPLSMHTLLIDGALLDNIGGVVRALGDQSIVYGLLFYIFVLIASATLLNMLIGVLCEVISAVAATEKDEISVNYVREKLQELLQIVDNGDGEISKSEFVQMIDIPQTTQVLQDVGVDTCDLLDLSDFIFECAEEKEDGEQVLPFVDFLEVILQLRGSNSATVKDTIDLRKFVRNTRRSTEERILKAVRCHINSERLQLQDRSASVIQNGWRRRSGRFDVTQSAPTSLSMVSDSNVGDSVKSDSDLRNAACSESMAPPPPSGTVEATPPTSTRPAAPCTPPKLSQVEAPQVESPVLPQVGPLSSNVVDETGAEVEQAGEALSPVADSSLSAPEPSVSSPASYLPPVKGRRIKEDLPPLAVRRMSKKNTELFWVRAGKLEGLLDMLKSELGELTKITPDLPHSQRPEGMRPVDDGSPPAHCITSCAESPIEAPPEPQEFWNQLSILEQSVQCSMAGLSAIRSRLGGNTLSFNDSRTFIE